MSPFQFSEESNGDGNLREMVSMQQFWVTMEIVPLLGIRNRVNGQMIVTGEKRNDICLFK